MEEMTYAMAGEVITDMYFMLLGEVLNNPSNLVERSA